MANLRIYPSKLSGSVHIPSSKSHTLRAILFAALASGTSTIRRYLRSPDTEHMIEAIRMLGAEVEVKPDLLRIQGVSGKPQLPDDIIQCGNSGIALRFLTAIVALLPGISIVTGDESIRHNRPMTPLLNALRQLGAQITSMRGDEHAPLIIQGPWIHHTAQLDGSDSQFVSALLIASALRSGITELHVTNPGEKPWVDLTLNWLRRFDVSFQIEDHIYYRIEGGKLFSAFTYTVPGDFSSAAFPIAAALLTQSELTLNNLDMNDVQGDRAIIPILEEMGACFTIEQNRLTVHAGPPLKGTRIDINDCIDALPILAVIATAAKTPTELYNGEIARTKETDRISAIAIELKKMGVFVEEKSDGLVIFPSKLKGAILESYLDHRLALSLAIAALAADAPCLIQNTECMVKTYPTFAEDFSRLGARIE